MIEIQHEDCIQGLSKIEDCSVDLVVADPPYQVGKDYGNQSDNNAYHTNFTDRWLSESKRILKPTGSIYVFMGSKKIAELFLMMERRFLFDSWIVWNYTQGMGQKRRFSARHEDILFFTKTKEFKFYLSAIRQPQKCARSINNPLGANPGDVWSIPHVHHNKSEYTEHPTQKPEAVIDRIIQASSSFGDLVVDPFVGSGTTAVVCKKRKRNFLGWELNKKYVEIANFRLTELDNNLL